MVIFPECTLSHSPFESRQRDKVTDSNLSNHISAAVHDDKYYFFRQKIVCELRLF